MTQVRLVKKLAERLNGVDLSRYGVGDILDLNEPVAAMMIAEGWAQPLPLPASQTPPAEKKTE